MLCPCESGKPFSECHGKLDEQDKPKPKPPEPIFIHDFKVDEGRTYKVIGTNPHQAHQEALKAARWLERQAR